MHKIQFVKFNPGSGMGDKQMAISADEHTGRSLRTISAEVVALEGDSRQSIVIDQEAEEEFTTIDDHATAGGEGGIITINGRSNSDKLSFKLTLPSKNAINAELPEVYYIEGIELPSNVKIPGDPGQFVAFDYSINLHVNNNVGKSDLTGAVVVTDGAGNKATCQVRQTADEVLLEVPVSVINLPRDGSPQVFDIYSNAAWRIRAAIDNN